MIEGLLLIDKPTGWTSFDVVNYVRRIVATAEGKKPKHVKVGHTGTLDPFATGLLVLLIGKTYTRRAGEFNGLDKTYEVTAQLGATSSTGDPEGKITAGPDTVPKVQDLRRAIARFQGDIMQVPPAYSAIKINGQRAYKLARAGQAVILEPRSAIVHRLEITDYTYPEVKLTAEVSAGTYIRSLVADLGQALGTGAYTIALRRTTVGPFKLTDACQAETLTPERITEYALA